MGEGVRKLAPYLFMYHFIRKLKLILGLNNSALRIIKVVTPLSDMYVRTT